ncbi:MAG TPA: SsrA-binding protein SmpB [Patescibacteria group bacterium]|nr:SsrA-binding protein SmpB [Patescibacteria group bacterium]
MSKKPAPKNHLILNRRARFDYELHEHMQAGIVLTGAEVRAVRDGRVSLRGSFATIRNGELWLTNASFSLPPQPGKLETVIDTSPRKLLVKSRELAKLIDAKDQSLTIIPLSMTTKTRYIKVDIATAKGKKQYDKREVIKQRDTERDNRRFLKQS